MAKYYKKGGKKVEFNGHPIKIDTKNRMYIEVESKKTILENINGIIQIKGE